MAPLLVLQLIYTKLGCFLCEWSRSNGKNHFVKKHWPKRDLIQIQKKGISLPLAIPEKVNFPLLHIKNQGNG